MRRDEFGSDRELIRQFERGPGQPVPIDTSPLAIALMGYLESIDRAAGTITLSFQPSAAFSQLPGTLQGGSVATMLDFAMSFAALAAIDYGEKVTTTSLSVTYMRSAKIGGFNAVGEIERRGRMIVFTRAKLLDANGITVASGLSTLAVLG